MNSPLSGRRGPRRSWRRPRTAAFVAAGVLVALSAPVVTGAGVPSAFAFTVTGTVSGDHAWDVQTQQQYPDVPSVTVDQNDELTDQVIHVTWQHFTPSSNDSGTFFSQDSTRYAVTVLECKGTNPADPTSFAWPDFGPDCYNYTPDDDNAAHGVGNQAYTLTGADGTGGVYFHAETKDENDFLGCDSTDPCSIVVVPNWGGKQPAGLKIGDRGVDCTNHSGDTSFTKGDYAYASHLGGACSWADRIVVPLHFAPTPANCAASNYAFAAEGAPMLARTMEQWQAGWCATGDKLSFDFDSGVNEYLARDSFLGGSGALSATTDLAVVNRPASASEAKQRPFRYAPIANTGIAIAYHVDNQVTGQLIDDLTLDARLVAKLLTQSYSLDFGCVSGGDTTHQGPTCDPAVKGNPQDIFDDPEFQALNPQYTRADFPATSLLNRGQFLPLVVSGNSDLVHELTRWIESDPDARAFLAGTPDRWGMHVNTYYKDEGMPLDQFATLDPGYTAPESNGVPGISTMQVTWNPLNGLDNVASSLVIDRPSGINPTLPPCGDGVPCVYQRFGSQPPGNRAVFAVVGLPDAAADRFPTARLVNASGHAVAPTDTGLSAALGAMTVNAGTTTRSADFASRNPAQYPLTMVEYAMVPSCGLTTTQATGITSFLHHVTTSQTVGQQPGQLAPGDLPLTAAERSQVQTATSAVSTTACPKPPTGGHHPSAPPHRRTSGHTGSGGGSTGGSGDGGVGGPVGTGTTPTPSAARSTAPAGPTSSAVAAPASSAALAGFGVKHSDSSADPGMILPILLIVVAVLLVGGPGALLFVGARGGSVFGRRLPGARR